MTPHRVSTMQFADVSFALLQELWDGKVPRKELMLQNAANVAQICGLEVLTPHDQDIAHRCVLLSQTDAYTQGCFRTRVLLHRDAFHKDMFFYICLCIQMLLRRDAFTRSCLYSQVLLYRDSFTPSSFCAQTRRYFYTQMPLHSNAFTRTCCTQAVL